MKYLFYLFLALLLTGCRATRKVVEQSTVMQTEENETDSSRVETTDLSTLSRRLEELQTEAEDMNITITSFSPPDSTGKQHKTASATIQYNRKTDRRKQEEDSLVLVNEQTEESTHSKAQAGTLEQREREHKEKPPERWPYVMFVLIALAIGYSVYRKLK